MGSRHYLLRDMISSGNTSDVWQWSPTTVVKLLHPGIPTHWAALEADITTRVHAAGLPVPATEGMVVIDGRPGIVFEHIRGVSMWDQMKASQSDLLQLTKDLISLQIDLHAVVLIDGIPDLVARLLAKIGQVKQLSEEERREAADLLASLPKASALCHGDMHPGNILLSPRGMIVIDWFDAAVGHPTADFVRSLLLMRPPSSERSAMSHLGGTGSSFLTRLRKAYFSSLTRRGLLEDTPFAEWEAVLAVARMSEPVPTADLVRIWRSRRVGANFASIHATAQQRVGSDRRSPSPHDFEKRREHERTRR